MGKVWEHLSRGVDERWTWGGGATTYSCAINLRVSILSQAEHSQSHECLESCLEIYRALIDEV